MEAAAAALDDARLTCGRLVICHPLRVHFGGFAWLGRDVAEPDTLPAEVVERRARGQELRGASRALAIVLVAHHEAIVGIPEGKRVAAVFDRIEKAHVRTRRRTALTHHGSNVLCDATIAGKLAARVEA